MCFKAPWLRAGQHCTVRFSVSTSVTYMEIYPNENNMFVCLGIFANGLRYSVDRSAVGIWISRSWHLWCVDHLHNWKPKDNLEPHHNRKVYRPRALRESRSKGISLRFRKPAWLRTPCKCYDIDSLHIPFNKLSINDIGRIARLAMF